MNFNMCYEIDEKIYKYDLDIFLKEFENFINNINDLNDEYTKFTLVLKKFNVFFDKLYYSYSENYNIGINQIKDALDYAMVGKGKRIRPFIIFLSYYVFGGKDYKNILPFMLAIEMIHTFSLIHDDLPAIDNDTLRRGKKSVWAKYGEDIAILVGDLLIHNGYSIIAEYIKDFNLRDTTTLKALNEAFYSIINLSGQNGMIKGEILDVIETGNKNLKVDDLLYIYEYKTSKLLYIAFEIGAVISKSEIDKEDLYRFSNLIGLSYQIKDDLLELTSDEKTLGKIINSDLKNNKITVANLLGIEKTEKMLKEYNNEIISIIERFSLKNKNYELLLSKFVEYLLKREY